ncbi:hypothetical protein FA014_01910 [Cellulomonas hominis]|uniref:HK97 gp10 family phage protein n=1 Tax=Cellulomonas hominis TaxID=156981 RepID=A0A7Z8NQM7_9CELL|nr:hypothetical protein FA014_01910 [Cellulomonas hominis]
MTIRWEGATAKEAVRRGTARGLRLAAEHVLAESLQVVPIDDGTLARSGATAVDESGPVAAVSFDTPYAVRQHEDMTLRHTRGRTAKYLERPLLGTRRAQEQLIGDAVRQELR